MAINLPGQTPEPAPRLAVLSKVRVLITLGLLVLLILCVAFSWTTRDAMGNLPFLHRPGDPGRVVEGQNTLVDLSPWQTAQALAALAVTAEETESAREAERLADHGVDQAFAAALRQASLQHYSLSGEALAISKRISQFQQIVDEDQARVQSLTQAAGSASATHRAAPATATDDLDIAKAQLGLDSDELADAQQDLARAGGDERGRIQQELSTHEAAMKKYDEQVSGNSQVAVVSAQQHGSLAGLINEWFNQRTRSQLVQQARQKALRDVAALTAQHNELESRVNIISQAAASGNPASGPAPDKAATLDRLKNRTARSQLLGIYDDRIQTQKQLAAVYQKWSTQLVLQHRILLHLMLQSFALIAFILICAIVFDALVRRLLNRPTLDRRRMHTLRVIFTLGIEVLGVLLILLVVFGAPSQMPTILGLTTAGLTVVLQDFIIAFFGWFVLMGKNGIRIGDWVEINGVGGEVIEIGIFRTALLETGNWTDTGHPTGRRVTFINSFAIKGQYFNFSTTGQWMWDEIRLSIPAGVNTYEIIELIHKAVIKETEKDTRLAAEEWKRVTRRIGLSPLTAGPAVDLRPGASGIDIIVRYVTRASDRFEVRNRLYQCVVDLLHKPIASPPQLDQPTADTKHGAQ
jgi:small-conductance mechanosensitive channel